MKLTRSADGHPYQVLAGKIAETIRREELKAGQALPTIRKLMEKYGSTNATTQRALKQLVDDGYVKAVPSVGYFVLPEWGNGPGDSAVTLEHRVAALENEVAELRRQLQSLAGRSDSGGAS